ncbi:MAG: type II toxin-antitoxin system VapC family toxin [Moorea sp. SIOASIH]|uniref:hypothetical protein n=1 Tax=Moorena sp. SIOASIH TaxID=2607817 RepID=UPI0013BB4B3F|nr:hypothetical protein [Moorena sp. SIOASIH]NEO39573.1 type II toxin-antitoxin system VapC family toxin [Moorena sp. SIOASIH]
MKALLDTHAFLGYLLGDTRLAIKANSIIDTKAHTTHSNKTPHLPDSRLPTPDSRLPITLFVERLT